MTVANVKTSGGWEALQKVGPQGPPGYDTAPIGAAIYWTGTDGTVPPEWALANGQRLARSSYPDAYTYARTQADAGNPLWTYRTSDETFTVPDFVSKFIYGKGAGSLPSLPTTGQETVALTHDQSGMKNHAHTGITEDHYHGSDGLLTTGGHSHGISGSGTASATGFGTVSRAAGSGSTETPGHTHPVSIGGGSDAPGNLGVYGTTNWSAHGGLDFTTSIVPTTGGNAPTPATAHNNMPPHVIAAIIIKVRGVSILYDAIVGPSGPQGLIGPVGPQGVAGPQGVRGPQGSPQRVTALPAVPLHDDEIVFVADATNGVLWHLRYNGQSASAFKWEFMGGSPISKPETSTHGSVPATLTADPNGPVVPVPLAGDYILHMFMRSDTVPQSQQLMWYLGYSAGNTPMGLNNRDNIDWVESGRMQRCNNMIAGTMSSFVQGTVAGGRIMGRHAHLIPVRVG